MLTDSYSGMFCGSRNFMISSLVVFYTLFLDLIKNGAYFFGPISYGTFHGGLWNILQLGYCT